MVECSGLENQQAGNGLESSNLSLSAKGGSHGRKLMAISLFDEKDSNTQVRWSKAHAGACTEYVAAEEASGNISTSPPRWSGSNYGSTSTRSSWMRRVPGAAVPDGSRVRRGRCRS